MEEARDTLRFLHDFWDGHELEGQVTRMASALEGADQYTEIKTLLAARLADRMGAFKKLCSLSVFGNFSDVFWTVQWAGDVCHDNDVVGEHRLI
eukprot:6766911-Pyramimonas_sp.AAC.1